MSTTATPRHTPARTNPSDLQAGPAPHDGQVDTAEVPRRRLLDRISEAVRAAHTASVPF